MNQRAFLSRRTFYRRLRKLNRIHWFLSAGGAIRGYRLPSDTRAGEFVPLMDAILDPEIPWHRQMSHRDYYVLSVCSRNGETRKYRTLKRTREALLRATVERSKL